MRRKDDDNPNVFLKQVHPMDLIRYGLIPEFTGRISVITSLTELDEDDLVRILQEPKNALIKQYQKMFELENVELKFTTNAMRALAAKAIKLETGARGLRSVMESIMLDIMYTIPSMKNVSECVINSSVIEEGKQPLILFRPEAKSA